MIATMIRPADTRLSDTLELGALPSAVPSARLHTRAVLTEWGLGELADDAESIVAELVANSVAAHRREHLDAPVRLALLADANGLVILVRDASHQGPVRNHPDVDLDREDGRGLVIVNELSTSWSWEPVPGGKVIRSVLAGGRHV